jgi:two-component system CheB/CheR fusion protein
MANLLASTDVGTIFLDNQLCVQRFTPAVTRLVNLIQTDVGRPLSDITINLADQNLVADTTTVLDTLTPTETEVRTPEGHWFSARIRPYRTLDNIIEGAVITFIDITEQKRVHQQLQTLSQAVEQSPNSVIITDTRGTIEYVNPYFVRQTGYTAQEAVGRKVNIIKSAETPAAVFKDMWQTIKRGSIWLGEVRNRRKDGAVYSERVSIYPVLDHGGKLTHYVSIQSEIKDDP